MGYYGTILKTTDEGEHWLPQNINISGILNSVNFYSEDLGIIVGDAGLIYNTFDGGQHWNNCNSPTKERLNSVFYLSQTKALVV